jgi:preprotein translocase subunit SecA
LGAVTVATNMAGRGTDILLGGNPSLLAKLRLRDALAASGCLAPSAVAPPTAEPTAEPTAGTPTAGTPTAEPTADGGPQGDAVASAAPLAAPAPPKPLAQRAGPPLWRPMPESYYPATLSEEALALVAKAAAALLGDPASTGYDPEVKHNEKKRV